VSPSSTSSSSRWPLAGLLAALLLLAADAALLGPRGIWSFLAARDPEGRAQVQRELQRVRGAPSYMPRAFVIGTSRVQEGFDPELASRELPDVAIGRLGQPRIEPFVIRQLVPEVVAARPVAVAILLSEFDTHRPLRLEPVPDPGTASLGALFDLLRATGLRFALQARESLYRIAACSALDAYRYRPLLRTAGLGALREFTFDERFGNRQRGDPFRPIALWGGVRHDIPEAARRSTFDLFPPAIGSMTGRLQAGTIGEISRGPHVAVQEFLIRRAVEELREAGVRVAIVEGPLHPASADLYDAGLRREFLAFAHRLEQELDVEFLPLESLAPYAESDFYDLVHVGPEGVPKLTRSLIAGLRAAGT
jgi:hypothetical protein